MKPTKTGSKSEADLFRSRLDQMINMRHELVRLAASIDWKFFDQQFEPLYSEIGRPPAYSERRTRRLRTSGMFHTGCLTPSDPWTA